jgi:hypothetical protein
MAAVRPSYTHGCTTFGEEQALTTLGSNGAIRQHRYVLQLISKIIG